MDFYGTFVASVTFVVFSTVVYAAQMTKGGRAVELAGVLADSGASAQRVFGALPLLFLVAWASMALSLLALQPVTPATGRKHAAHNFA